MTLKYGSRGDDVKNLQKQLSGLGYNLAADGIFGQKTLAAVKDYQKKNKLAVDGIVGTKTSAALSGSGASSTKTASSGKTAKATAPAQPAWKPSKQVTGAYDAWQQALANKPGEYKSQYQELIDAQLDKILNREDFNYDFNADPMYQQYKNQYVQQGQQAMMDTMGNAAALTGGYGSSYATTAGNQAYQQYLGQLNNVIPELYNAALSQYNMEGQQLYDQYGALTTAEQDAYNKYQGTLEDYYNQANLMGGRYDTLYGQEYGRYETDLGQWNANREFEEAQRQFNEQLAENQRQFNEQMAAKAAAGRGSGGSGSGKGKTKRNTKAGLHDKASVKNYVEEAYANDYYGMMEYLKKKVESESITQAEANEISEYMRKKYGVVKPTNNGSGSPYNYNGSDTFGGMTYKDYMEWLNRSSGVKK